MTAVWLALFFRLTAIAPGVARVLKPALIRLAWIGSSAVRRATTANGKRLAPGVPPRRFGLAVLGHFYDFVTDVRQADGDATVAGADHYHAARAAGRGVVIVTAHVGPFEAGLAAVPAGERVHVVFKRDAVAAFERLRQRSRGRLNVTEAAVDGGLAVWAELRAALRRDEIVAVQGDRVLPGQSGQAVAMFGGHVRLPPGPFKLARSADAPVVPIFAAREDGRVTIHIRPPIAVDDVPAAVERYAAELADHVARHPTQWLLLSPAFAEYAACQKSSSSPSPP